jgi:hypothetical protein
MFNQKLPPSGTGLAKAHAGKTPEEQLLDTQNGETNDF